MNDKKISFSLHWKKQAVKYIKKQDAPTQKRFQEAISFLKEFPFENRADIEPLEANNIGTELE